LRGDLFPTAPATELDEDRLEGIPTIRECVGSQISRRFEHDSFDDPGGLKVPEALSEDVWTDAVQSVTQFKKPLRAEQQLSDDQ